MSWCEWVSEWGMERMSDYDDKKKHDVALFHRIILWIGNIVDPFHCHYLFFSLTPQGKKKRTQYLRRFIRKHHLSKADIIKYTAETDRANLKVAMETWLLDHIFNLNSWLSFLWDSSYYALIYALYSALSWNPDATQLLQATDTQAKEPWTEIVTQANILNENQEIITIITNYLKQHSDLEDWYKDYLNWLIGLIQAKWDQPWLVLQYLDQMEITVPELYNIVNTKLQQILKATNTITREEVSQWPSSGHSS